MTALAANTKRDGKRSCYDMYHSFPVSATAVIHQGSGIVLNGGYAEPATAALALKTVGVAMEAVTGGVADGDVFVSVRQGIFKFANSASADAIAQDDVGKPCYWVDDNTVALTDGTGARSFAGVIYAVDTTGVYVTMTFVNDGVVLQAEIDAAEARLDVLEA